MIDEGQVIEYIKWHAIEQLISRENQWHITMMEEKRELMERNTSLINGINGKLSIGTSNSRKA